MGTEAEATPQVTSGESGRHGSVPDPGLQGQSPGPGTATLPAFWTEVHGGGTPQEDWGAGKRWGAGEEYPPWELGDGHPGRCWQLESGQGQGAWPLPPGASHRMQCREEAWPRNVSVPCGLFQAENNQGLKDSESSLSLHLTA